MDTVRGEQVLALLLQGIEAHRPEVARCWVELSIDLQEIITVSILQAGVSYALRQPHTASIPRAVSTG